MSQDIIRVLRVVEYEGPRGIVEATICKSIHGERRVGDMVIRAATLGEFPQILRHEETKTSTPAPIHDDDCRCILCEPNDSYGG